ncbi:MAG TPA: zf-HC2 domain-containing protein [Trebonia sp.]
MLLAGPGRRDPGPATGLLRRLRPIALGLPPAGVGDGDPARPHASVHEPRHGTAWARLPAMSEHGAMTCAQVRDVVAELALGVLTGRERGSALAHLEGCRACREDVSLLMVAGGQLLELLPPAEPPAGFETRVLEWLASTVSH